TVTISSITGDGTLGITLAAGTAKDLAGNSALATPASSTVSIKNTENITLMLTPGWNLASCMVEFNASEVFGDSTTYASVWKWLASEKRWEVYLPTDPDNGEAYAKSKGFELLSTVLPGEGFWVNVQSDKPPTTDIRGELAKDPSLALAKGWNLLGLKSGQSLWIEDRSDAEKTAIESLWKWKGKEKKWAVSLPNAPDGDGGQAYADSKGFTLLESIDPGEGFWVNANEAITLP
ncbi:MAG: hypothetical protein Q8J76_07615, partial [Desulfobulbaceae bacterium]|nr:hypothetical protein [Desulfobulbaceae bacterium]